MQNIIPERPGMVSISHSFFSKQEATRLLGLQTMQLAVVFQHLRYKNPNLPQISTFAYLFQLLKSHPAVNHSPSPLQKRTQLATNCSTRKTGSYKPACPLKLLTHQPHQQNP